jgi:Flp pilus assembly protein TadG
MLAMVWRHLRRLERDRAGVSAVEFAIVASIMVALVLAAFDFGNAAQTQIRLQQAVRAAGAYAVTCPTDTAGIQTAVTNALPSGWALSSAPGVTCSCLNPGTNATSATVCTAPNCVAPADAKIIKITATMPYTGLASPFFSALASNTASYVVRYQ